MPTLRQRVLQLLQNGDGLTDREIADRVFAPGAAQQPVNQTCHQMESQGQLFRRSRPDGKIGNYLAAAMPQEIQVTEPSPSDEFLSEDSVKLHLKNWLESQGWRAQVAWGKERGVDIEAYRQGQRWIIEAKGGGSRDPMRVNYFLAILGETLQRMKDPEAKYSIAVPDLRQFRNLWMRLPALAKARTGITALFVNIDGTVQEVSDGAGSQAPAG